MNFIDDYEEFDSNKIWVGKPQKIFENTRMCTVYQNPNNYKKIIIKTPFLLIPYGPSILKKNKNEEELNNNWYTITSVLAPLIKKRKKFKNLIEEIESSIKKKITSINNYKFCESIKDDKKNNYKYNFVLGLPHTKKGEKMFRIVNHKKEKCNISDIKPGMTMISTIMLNDVWINDKKKEYRCLWNIVQMRIYPKIIIDECLFVDELSDGSIINQQRSKEKYIVPCPNCDHKIEFTININIQGSQQYISKSPYNGNPSDYSIPIAPPLDMITETTEMNTMKPFVPKLDDLLGAIKKLKPTKVNSNISDKNEPIVNKSLELDKKSKSSDLMTRMQKLLKKIKKDDKYDITGSKNIESLKI
jgi:hypothetical protein